VRATLLVAVVVLTGALALPIALLTQACAMLTLVTYTLVNLSLVALQRRDPTPEGRFRVPRWWPVLAALASGGLFAAGLWRLAA